MIAWIAQRVTGRGGGVPTAIGTVPRPADLELDGLDLPEEVVAELLRVDGEAWRTELDRAEGYLEAVGAPSALLGALHRERAALPSPGA